MPTKEKRKLSQKKPFWRYGEATNPIFEVFYLENAHGLIADFSGNPPYEF